MARGKGAKVGDTRVSQNGYHYTRTKDKWRLTHHIIAENVLGRALQSGERVSFADGDRTNLDPSNIVVKGSHKTSLHRRKAQLEARIDELKGQLADLEDEIETQASS